MMFDFLKIKYWFQLVTYYFLKIFDDWHILKFSKWWSPNMQIKFTLLLLLFYDTSTSFLKGKSTEILFGLVSAKAYIILKIKYIFVHIHCRQTIRSFFLNLSICRTSSFLSGYYKLNKWTTKHKLLFTLTNVNVER